MLTLTALLLKGKLTITGKDSGKQVASALLDEGHVAELAALQSYLRQFCAFNAVISVDGIVVGAWSVFSS